jgi:DNA-binding CsgD family transcriptional regulator
VAETADDHSSLGDRRLAVLTILTEVVQADAGVWAWGRGWPSSAVTPVAHIDIGCNDTQRIALIEWGMDAEIDRTFRDRVREQMGTAHAATTLWRDVYSPEEWDAQPPMRRRMVEGGWSSWLHTVSYSDDDTWSNFFLLRVAGRPEFGPEEAAVAGLVLTGVPWLRSAAEEYVPPESFAGLTPRQRTVMLMLLDGLPRKTIARRLDIGKDTVGDHIKSIYAHFGVGSVGELAALFLRDR